MEYERQNKFSVYVDESISRQYPSPDIYVIAAIVLPQSSPELHSSLSKIITLDTYKSARQFRKSEKLQPKAIAHWINELSPQIYISYNWQYRAEQESVRAHCLRALFQRLSKDRYFNLILDSRESMGHGKLFFHANNLDRQIMNHEISAGRVARNMRIAHLTDQKEPLLHCADLVAFASRVHILGQDSEVFNLLQRKETLENIFFN